MSDHSNYHTPAANDPALDLTGAQRSDTASGGYAEGTADPSIPSPSPGYPEFDQPVASDALRLMQQEPSILDAELDEIMRQPLPTDHDSSEYDILNPSSDLDQQLASHVWQQPLAVDNNSVDPFPAIGESINSNVFGAGQQEQQSSFGVSANDLFDVSITDENDLEDLSKIHAQASASDPLACCTMKKPEDFGDHLKLGRYHYDQAFATKEGALFAVILKATNQDSGEIVGCACLHYHILFRGERGIGSWLPDDSLRCCLKTHLYEWVYTKIHWHRRTALLSTTGIGHMETRPHYFVRSLDILKSLSADHQLQVHRKLVSFISGFKPEHHVFAQVPSSDSLNLKAFEDEGWEPTVDADRSQYSCPEELAASLEDCPIKNRNPKGWLRLGVSKPGTSMSQDLPSPRKRYWPLGLVSGAPHSSSLREQALHDSHIPMGTPLSHPNDNLNNAISIPAIPRAIPPTITVNFLVQGDRPFIHSISNASKKFEYLEFAKVPTGLSVGLLIRGFRPWRPGLKAVIVMLEKRVGFANEMAKWSRGDTFVEGTAVAGMTLAQLGWGSRIDPVWLVVD